VSHNYKFEFDYEIFFTAILPPIIFAAGYTLKKREFFDNFRYIVVFGVLGTLLAFSVISSSAYLLSRFDSLLDESEKLSVSDCMLLACILSSTDTVAALTLVKADQFPKLNSILFGEGIVNDAVSILLFRTIKTFFLKGDAEEGHAAGFSFGMVLSMSWDFIVLSFFSLLIGISLGLLLSLVFKNIQAFSEKPKLETCMVLLTGYMSYLIAEYFHFSGIISMFSCGLVMSHYTMQNLSEESQKGTVLIFDAFGYLAETFVFIYLGTITRYFSNF
jgi:NhaP-type Na+/H+ and K+/H+ antiporters